METKTFYPVDLLTRGIPQEKLETEAALAVISAKIYLRRIELGLDQKSFAKLMGVSQCMVSKWESENYNFSISTLVKICKKLDLEFIPEIAKKEVQPVTIAYREENENETVSQGFRSWKPSETYVTGGVA